jgi:poly [ADP-ribose] polymerase
MLNQLLQRVWSRSDPATALTRLSEQRNLTVEPVTDSHVLTLIQRMMGGGKPGFGAVFSVRQVTTEAAFNAHVRNRPNRKTLALWHDCPDGLSMLQPDRATRTAAKARPPFGQGIRFTDQFRQARLWPDDRQRIVYGAIYEVHLGNQLELTTHKPEQAAPLFPNSLDDQYDSVFVRQSNRLQANEFIIYNPAQYTIRYLVQISA